MRCTALLLVALAGSALAVPAGQRNSCAAQCDVSNTFKYQPGQSYVYEYSVTTSTALLGTYDDDAHLHITANAHIDVSAPCEYVLRLTDVGLDGSSHGAEFAAAVTKSPLRFAFQDGHVESLCSEVSEPAWVLNFKRGVLSTFQNSMYHWGRENVDETDISGMCKAHYNTTVEGDVVTIDKVKDLASCTHRPDLGTYIPSSGYVTDSPIQSLPLFKSNNKCQQRVEEGVLKMAECEETHVFRPFSSDKGGAVTTAKTTMFLVSQGKPEAVSDFEYVKKTMVFEQPEDSIKAQLEEVEKVLSDIETASQNDIRPEVAQLFSRLVEFLKPLDYSQLSTFYNNAAENRKKFLVDAMPLVGTASAFGVIRDMFISNDLSETEADIFFTSLAFIKNPTSDMFTMIAPLVEKTSQQALLGSSALINTYCKLHSDCESDSGIQQILRVIESELGSGCRTTNDEEKVKVLVALKALGNAGHFVNANSVLRRCYTEENNMEVRVAAIEAWRHTPCEYDRSHLLAAFQDENQDTEIRIAAYLALMTCPNPSLIDTIKDRLTSEGVNQVGSFIWTHMTNMQESAAPGKQFVRQMIGEELLQKKFNTEALKFSRNYESSFFMNELNAGAAVESNVIFSSKSFLPRSAMLNLTIDLFGESINFFEVGGRIEKFESYIERFFGSNGYFPEETIENILRNMRRNSDTEATTLEGFLEEMTDEPEGSYYLRMFGNELYYHHFQGLENIFQASEASNPLEFLMDLARKGDVDYKKSFQMINARMAVPTITGLPLTLSAKGTATVGLKMNGNFKARSLRNVNIEGYFHPSASIQIEGEMLIDAHVSQTGMKLSSNMHTSTYLDGKLQINGGKLVEFNINTPTDKIEIIDVKSEFIYIEDDQEIIKGAENVIQQEGCTSGVTGVALCGALSYNLNHGPFSPFPGPYSTQVYLKKTDSQSGYVFRFTNQNKIISVEFDTPGSQSDHKFSLELTDLGNTASINVHTPFKSFQGSGEYVWRKNNKNVKAALNIEGDGEYSVNVGLKTTNGMKSFEPSLIIMVPSGELLNLQASFINGLGYYESVLSSKIDMEYSFTGKQEYLHYSGLYKRDLKEDLVNYDDENTYAIQLNLDSSAFPAFKTEFEATSIVLKNNVVSKAKLVHGTTTWNAEQAYKYENNNEQTVLNMNAAVSCPSFNIDSVISESLTISANQLQSESYFKLLPGKEYSLKINLEKLGYMDVKGEVSAALAGFSTSATASFKKAGSQYNVEVSSTVNGQPWSLEGQLKNDSQPGNVITEVNATVKTPSHEATFQFDITGNIDKVDINFKSTIDNQDYTIKLEGTPSSILIDANIVKHIFIKSYFQTTEERKKIYATVEWDKDVDPKIYTIDGQFSLGEILAKINIAGMEYSAIGKIVDDGLEFEAKWPTDKKVIANVHYTKGSTKSLTVTVETPILGWEKQDASFSITLNNFEIESRFTATWKNAEQLALSASGNLQPGLYNNALTTKVSFTSSFENFERITFSLDHNMADLTINTNMVGIWGQSKMEGHFNLIPNNDGLDARASFTSPVTQDALMTVRHVLANKELTTLVEAKYGSDVSTASLKGHFDISQIHEVSLSFKIETPIETVPEIDANIEYTMNNDNLSLVAEGKIGEKKVNLNIKGQIVTSGDSTDISGDLRFLTPFTYPLTATFKHTHDMEHFTSQFEMTRFWSTYGSVKTHMQGLFTSANNLEFTADLSSPESKAMVSLKHKIENNVMTSKVNMNVNGEQIIVAANGDVDAEQRLASLKIEFVSTIDDIQDVKVDFETHKNNNAQISKVIVYKGEHSVTFDHVLSFNDWFNWENSFVVNSIYTLKNKQTHAGTNYMHDLEYIWDNNSVHFTGSTDIIYSGNNRQFDVILSLMTPWMENKKIEIHHQDDNSEFKDSLTLEYKPGQEIILNNNLKFEETSVYFEARLMTPFWQDLGYKLNLDFQPRKAATLVLIRGENKTTIDINGKWEQGKLEGQMMVDSTYITKPVSLEISYDFVSNDKKINSIFTFDKSYELTATLSGDIKAAKASLKIELPFDYIQKVEITGEYQVEAMPYNANLVFLLNNKTYQVTSIISSNSFKIDANFENEVGSLDGNWNYEENYADVKLNFISPFLVLDNMSISGMYDLREQKKVTVKLVQGSQEINISGQYENETILVEATTPFAGWENLKGSFFMSYSAINAFVSRNERKIEVNGTLHVRAVKGKINLTITTPYVGYETITVDIKYDLPTEIKTLEFKSLFGNEELSLKGTLNLANSEAPEMNITVVTPFEDFKTMGGMAKWNLTSDTRSAEIEVYKKDQTLKWSLELSTVNPTKVIGKFNIASPIEGWTSVNVEGIIDWTTMPYNMKLSFEKEGDTKVLEAQFNVEENKFNADISSPIIGWEKIVVNGEYILEENSITGKIAIAKGSEVIEIEAVISNEEYKPKCNLKITTPFASFTSVEFNFEANMTEIEKKIVTLFKIENVIYSLDITAKHVYKKGFFKAEIKSPITGYTSTDIYAKYDFTEEVKICEIDLTNENDNKHFTVAVQVNDNNFDMAVMTPFTGFEVIKINGDLQMNDEKISALGAFEKNSQKYNVILEVLPNEKKAVFQFESPIPQFRNIALNANYEINNSLVEGHVVFKKNDEEFVFDGRYDPSIYKTDIEFAVTTPVEGWKQLALNMHYDFLNSKKTVDVSVKKEANVKNIHIEGELTSKTGSLTIQTPFYENLGGKITFSLDNDNKKIQSTVLYTQNYQEFLFNAYGEYSANNVVIKFEVPFKDYENISIEGHFDPTTKIAEGTFEFGPYKFTSKISYAEDDLSFQLTTPFQVLKLLSINAKYNLMSSQKDGEVNITYNDKKYMLKGVIQLNISEAEISFQATTPFTNFENLAITMRYNINNKDELMLTSVDVNGHTYFVKFSGDLKEKLAVFNAELKSPLAEWKDVKFEAKIDLTKEDQTIQVTLVRNGDVKEIAITGKLIGSTLDFNMITPFEGLKDLKLFAALNRSKRSVEFKYMQDSAQIDLFSSFNSMKLQVKSPFAVAQEITWEITKTDDDTFTAEWRRNENFINIQFKKQGKKTFKFDMEGEMKDVFKMSGNAILSNKGVVNFHLETPIESFKVIEMKFNYNLKEKSAKLEMSSSSSTFSVILELNKDINAHVVIPNQQQDTVIDGHFEPLKAKVDMTSRFAMVRSLNYEYELDYLSGLKIDTLLKINDAVVSLFHIEAPVISDSPIPTHVKIESTFNFRSSYFVFNANWENNEFNILFKQEKNGAEKHFNAKLAYSGSNLLEQGQIDITVENTFAQPERKANAKIEIDRTGSRKTLMVEFSFNSNQMFTVNLDYDANLQNPWKGDFNLNITTPSKKAAPWQQLSGKWDIESEDITLSFTIGQTSYSATGKLSFDDTNLVFTSSDPSQQNGVLQWHFEKSGPTTDINFKIGQEPNPILFRLNGNLNSFADFQVEGGFKAGIFMAHELLYKLTFNNQNNNFISTGTLDYDDIHGSVSVTDIHYNPSTKSGGFEVKIENNFAALPWEQIQISGNVDFNNKFSINGNVITNNHPLFEIDLNVAPLEAKKSNTTAKIVFSETTINLTFSHDFSQATSKSITAVAQFGGQESYVKISWNHQPNYKKFDGTVEFKSQFIGNVNIITKYDFTQSQEVFAEAQFSTTIPEDVNINVNWNRKLSPGHFEMNLVADSTISAAKHARVYAKADYTSDFNLASGLEWNDEKITFISELSGNKLSVHITTPFENFSSIEATIKYSFASQNKEIKFDYKRGSNEAHMNLSVDLISANEATLQFSLITPFDVLKIVQITADIKDGKANVSFQRNDNKYTLEGDAEFQADQSSVSMIFTPPSGQTIKLATSYDVEDFLRGTGSQPQTLASLELEFEGHTLHFNINGFRNSDRLNIQFQGDSSFEVLKNILVKVDTGLNPSSLDGKVEMRLNDFTFDMENHIEVQDIQHYNFKTKLESTLTPLPALTIGFGRNGEEYSVTIGYGADREITFSIEGKDNYQSGFAGKIDIPNFGYDGVKYEVEYGFENDNELHMEIEVELGQDGQEIEANFVYNSEGVKARLTSLAFGEHSLRLKRSIGPNDYSAEAVLDGYGIELRGGFSNDDTKYGALLEGQFFGRKFLFDCLYQSEGLEYTEGKLIFATPYIGFEKIGGIFTLANVNNKVLAHTEIHLPSYTLPVISGEINLDLNDMVKGHVTLDLAGQEFVIKTNINKVDAGEKIQGTIEIFTPFHALSYVNIEGDFKMTSEILESNMKISTPFGEYASSFLASDKIVLTWDMKSDNHVDEHIQFSYAGGLITDTMKFYEGEVKVVFNENSVVLETKYPSVNNIEGKLALNLNGKSHLIYGKMNLESTNGHLQTEIDLESDFFQGPRKLVLNVEIPNLSYKQIAIDMSLTSTKTYLVHFDLDLTSSVHASAKVDTPIFPKTTITIDLSADKMELNIETPSGTHHVKGEWHISYQVPVDIKLNFEIESPLLTEKYVVVAIASGTLTDMNIKLDLATGNVNHSLQGKLSVSNTEGSFLFALETPYKNINKASFDASLSFANKIELVVTALLGTDINTLNITYDNQDWSFLALARSPYIPTGQVSAEAKLIGELGKKLQAKMSLKTAQEAISGDLLVDTTSMENMKAELEVLTPFSGYEKLNVYGRYNGGDKYHFVLYANEPIHFKIDCEMGTVQDIIKGHLSIITPFQNFENIEAKVEVPLNAFGPNVSFNTYVDGYSYGANFGLRTKAPYELALGYHAADYPSGAFHLRTDSSFLYYIA